MNAIAHIKYLHEPSTENWWADVKFALDCIDHYIAVAGFGESYDNIRMSIKYDDSMSVVVHCNERMRLGVGYKTGEILYNIEEINEAYAKKPFVADRLIALFKQSSDVSFLLAEGETIQFGMMSHGLDPVYYGRTITPNVVKYIYTRMSPINMILAHIDRWGNNVGLPAIGGVYKDTLILPNQVWKAARRVELGRIYEILPRLKSYFYSIDQMYDTIPHNQQIIKFLKKGLLYTGDSALIAFGKYKNFLSKSEKTSLLLALAEEFPEVIQNFLQFMIDLREVSNIIGKSTVSFSDILVPFDIGEGFVFRKDTENGRKLVKCVDPEYSRLNSEKWKAIREKERHV